MASALHKANLKGLEADLWPRASAVDSLATEARRLKDKGVLHPFVYADIRKFMPAWAADDKDASDDDDDAEPSELEKRLSSALGVPKKKVHGTMPLAKWLACFEAYALAAAATEQWEFAASYAHKATCLQIARDRALGRPALVAVCYDEVVRKRLADRTQKNSPDSNPNKVHPPRRRVPAETSCEAVRRARRCGEPREKNYLWQQGQRQAQRQGQRRRLQLEQRQLE